MRLSELKEKCIRNYKKIIVIISVIIFVIFSNCIIGGNIVCRFTTKLSEEIQTEKDVNNIKGLYFLKEMSVDCLNINDVGFLENKNFLEYFSVETDSIDDWSGLRNCPKLKEFHVKGNYAFHNLKDFSDMPDIEEIHMGGNDHSKIESLDGLQDISDSLKKLTLAGIVNETNLNLEKFSNLRRLDVEHTSLREIHINTYLEYLDVSNNPYLQTVFLPSEYGTPETIVTNNSPYVNIIYQ